MYIKEQKFLVIGISKSGISACQYILNNGGVCYFFEQLNNEKILEAKNQISQLGGIEVDINGAEEILNIIDVVVLSPGVPINHKLSMIAKERKKRIVGEFEFGIEQLIPTIVGVTGTNGKTTTVHLISNVLKEAKRQFSLCGNVGIPITSEIENIANKKIAVAEVSSFQLETISSFCPHIACILNVSPDHLERHYTMENYVYLKKRIYKNQKESEYTLLNYDDDIVKEFSQDTKGKVIWVSTKEKVDGAYFKDSYLYWQDHPILQQKELAISGEHNIYNALFCIAVCSLLGIDRETIAKGLKEFKGIPHRIQLVSDKNGIKYYNDSKSTNTASTINAINSMKGDTILILGGSEKGEKYDNLFKAIKESPIKHTIITGASRFNMLEQAVKQGLIDFSVTPDFYVAIKTAKAMATSGDNVLLSPACASFDKFSGYEERGNAFIKVVEEL